MVKDVGGLDVIVDDLAATHVEVPKAAQDLNQDGLRLPLEHRARGPEVDLRHIERPQTATRATESGCFSMIFNAFQGFSPTKPIENHYEDHV